MYCEKLSLKDFRNYERLDLNLAPGLTIFQGENAAGKTTLLEAVYLLATTKSPRAGAEQELINFEAEAEYGAPAFARLATRIERKEDHVEAEILILGDGEGFDNTNLSRKRIKVNGAARRAIDLIGKINVVLFSPEDLDLVIGTPALRRRYLDVTLSQIDHRYLRQWQDYSKIVSQRNGFLRKVREMRRDPSQDELGVWNEELIKSGTYIIKRRREALASLSEQAGTLHAQLTGLVWSLLQDPTGGFELVYLPSVEIENAHDEAAIATQFEKQLAEMRQAELKRGVSLVGPHRDDFSFRAEGANIGTYGSRGQQRTAVLALKLAEVGWMQAQTGEQPILLLDDILSELDVNRRQYVLETVQAKADQILITTTDLALFGEQTELEKVAQLYKVAGGRVTLM